MAGFSFAVPNLYPHFCRGLAIMVCQRAILSCFHFEGAAVFACFWHESTLDAMTSRRNYRFFIEYHG
jgi:hypothetical protein